MTNGKEEIKKLRTEISIQRQEAQLKLKKIQDDKKKHFSCIVYCSNCQIVGRVLIPRGLSVKDSGCAFCGVRGTGYLVLEVKDTCFFERR